MHLRILQNYDTEGILASSSLINSHNLNSQKIGTQNLSFYDNILFLHSMAFGGQMSVCVDHFCSPFFDSSEMPVFNPGFWQHPGTPLIKLHFPT